MENFIPRKSLRKGHIVTTVTGAKGKIIKIDTEIGLADVLLLSGEKNVLEDVNLKNLRHVKERAALTKGKDSKRKLFDLVDVDLDGLEKALNGK